MDSIRENQACVAGALGAKMAGVSLEEMVANMDNSLLRDLKDEDSPLPYDQPRMVAGKLAAPPLFFIPTPQTCPHHKVECP
jgi:hypothetical protein